MKFTYMYSEPKLAYKFTGSKRNSFNVQRVSSLTTCACSPDSQQRGTRPEARQPRSGQRASEDKCRRSPGNGSWSLTYQATLLPQGRHNSCAQLCAAFLCLCFLYIFRFSRCPRLICGIALCLHTSPRVSYRLEFCDTCVVTL